MKTQEPDPVSLLSEAFLARFGSDWGKRLPEVARAIGLDIRYEPASSYDGVLLRITGVPRGIVVLSSLVREQSRQRFTLAHEIGHYLLPAQGVRAPCTRSDIENWSEELNPPERQANTFAADVLLPRETIHPYLQQSPRMDHIRAIAGTCETSLTATGYRLIELTSFRAAIVWSEDDRARWYKASDEFVRWIRKGQLSAETFAADCFKGRSVPDALRPVPATAWLFPKGLQERATILEHSIPMPRYNAVLTLLVISDSIEAWDDENEELDPAEFTINRKHWPTKR
jgi:hypothetical protein